jgi:ABC-2 type transport system ATP-binding protein
VGPSLEHEIELVLRPLWSLETHVEVPIVEVRRLTKRYGDFTALLDVDLDIRRGEFFALLGPNGAGKTTMMRVLMGILRPSSGTARIDGRDCFVNRVEVKQVMGFVPDEPTFPDYLRGLEIVQFVGAMHGLDNAKVEERAWPLLEQFELADATGEYAANYSRGMKKKLALVCALLHDPKVLVLDEPTTGLDPIATRRLHRLLEEEVRSGTTVLLSSHLLEQVERVCHRMAIINGGRLAALGTLDELRERTSSGATLEDIFLAVATEGSLNSA